MMNSMRKTASIQRTFLVALIIGLICNSAIADKITMKDGKTFEGRITFESSDKVRIEIAVTGSIKETKLLLKKDVAGIVKDAPDKVAFEKIKPLVPTPSLMSASAYQVALKNGPDAFLSEFPNSSYKGDVDKIKKILDEELDKVERGNIKIKGEWYSPKDQIDFKTLVESRVHLLRMEAAAKRTNYGSLIAAMREYEIIEENYFGTPAYPKALVIAQRVVPTLGRNLQRMNVDVDAVNAEWEKNKEQTEAVARAQIEAARTRDEKNHQAGLAVDKKAGIKWVRLNPRSKPSIEGYLKLAAAEMPLLQIYDIAKLEEQAKALVEVNRLIMDDKLSLAKSKLEKAAAIDLMKPKDDSSSSKRRTRPRSRSKKGGTKNYIPILTEQIKTKLDEAEKIRKAAEAAKKSESITKDLKAGGDKMADGGEKPADSADAFAALAQSNKKDTKDEKKGSPKKPTKKPTKKSPTPAKKEKETAPPPPAPVVEEEGISFSTIMIVLTGLLIVTIVVLKVLGIGGAKED